MAEFLASIFGTEKDRVNCPFYFKTGACTHGERYVSAVLSIVGPSLLFVLNQKVSS